VFYPIIMLLYYATLFQYKQRATLSRYFFVEPVFAV
jgi:hypothetical protein